MNKIHINPLLHFQNNNKNYILNSINNQIFQVTPELESWLIGNATEPLNDDNALKSLKKSFVISDDMNNGLNDIYDILMKKNTFKPATVCLLICQDCNLHCNYCYGNGGEYNNRGYMSFEVASKAIDILVANEQIKNKKINFFGGEPLLNFKLMKQIVSYIKGKGHIIAYAMTTNGTLINKDVEQFIIDNKISTQISIDGDERTQNMNRPYSNKRGSYKDVITATAYLREHGLLAARATVTKDNPNYDTQMMHLISLGFRDVTWGYAVETLTFQSLNEMLNSYQRLCDEYYKLVMQQEYTIAKKLGNITRYLKKIHNVSIRDRTCGAGHSYAAVDIDGNIYPCHRFVGCEEYTFGTVFQGNINQINEHKFYKEFGIKNHEKCLSCVARNFCGGGCMNMNYNLASSVVGSPDITCHQVIEEMKITSKLYTSLSQEQLSNILPSVT